MKIVSIDPGLDIAGVAVFCLHRFGNPNFFSTTATDWERALGALIEVRQFRTKASCALPLRLYDLAQRAAQLIKEVQPELVYIEVPAIAGDYARTLKGKRGSMSRAQVNALYEAMGALMVGLYGKPVIEVKAGREPKATRHALLASTARAAGVALPLGPEGGAMPDAWDAIYLGCFVLATRTTADLRQLRRAS